MATSSARRRPGDPTIYPEEERVGESMLQRWIVELLRPLLEWWLNVRCGREAFVGADQFIYWRQHDAHARVAPDVYVLPGVAPHTAVRTWKVWIDRVVPSFALEVVSDDWEKDYYEAPERYDELGVGELVIFDPFFEQRPEGVRWQVFRRVGKRGLTRTEATNEDRVRSRSLRCWLRAVGDRESLRLRVAEGPTGEEIVPTPEERERAGKERERAEKERERAEKEVALGRLAEMERQLSRLRGRKSKL